MECARFCFGPEIPTLSDGGAYFDKSKLVQRLPAPFFPFLRRGIHFPGQQINIFPRRFLEICARSCPVVAYFAGVSCSPIREKTFIFVAVAMTSFLGREKLRILRSSCN